MAKKKTIKIRQTRSAIGRPVGQRQTLRGLGLRRIHQVVEREDTVQVRGMAAKIPHLVEIVDDRSQKSTSRSQKSTSRSQKSTSRSQKSRSRDETA